MPIIPIRAAGGKNLDIYNRKGTYRVEKVNPFRSAAFRISFCIFLAIAYWLFSFSYHYIRSLNWVKNTATITEIINRVDLKKHKSKHDRSSEPDSAREARLITLIAW